MDRSSGLSGDFVSDVFEDKEGNLWVATRAGLDRFRDGLAELDYSVHRNFSLRLFSEAARLQFRAEVFNLPNRVNFETAAAQ
jgi:ligand-binding sensor domain-containing protein